MADKKDSLVSGSLPTGGMWEKQRAYGGKRMQDEFAAEERFILCGIHAGGELKLEMSEEPVPKTVLTVARMDDPDELFEVGTLSGPIAAMVPDVIPTDFPVVAFWTTVPTSKSEAVVLQADRKYVQ